VVAEWDVGVLPIWAASEANVFNGGKLIRHRACVIFNRQNIHDGAYILPVASLTAFTMSLEPMIAFQSIVYSFKPTTP
jgi:hypothetical protein